MRNEIEPKAGSESCGLHELLQAFRALAMAGDEATGRETDGAGLPLQRGAAGRGAGTPADRS